MIYYNYNNTGVSLNWKNEGLFRYIYKHQNGFSFQKNNKDFLQLVNNIVNWNFQRTIINNKIDVYGLKTVLDVGSGLGLFDIILSKINKNCNFFLLDKSEVNVKSEFEYYSKENNHGFYNSWPLVLDIIQTSNANLDQFNFLSPSDDWPESIDLVISMHSWCWHYPKEVYWDKLMSKLKIGGYLILDIINLENKSIADEISEDLKSVPNRIPLKLSNPYHPCIKEFTLEHTDVYGYSYCWQRKQ